MVFLSHEYYPNGGMNDFKKDFDSLEEAKKYLVDEDELYRNPIKKEYEKRGKVYTYKQFEEFVFHIFDLENNSIVFDNDDFK